MEMLMTQILLDVTWTDLHYIQPSVKLIILYFAESFVMYFEAILCCVGLDYTDKVSASSYNITKRITNTANSKIIRVKSTLLKTKQVAH